LTFYTSSIIYRDHKGILVALPSPAAAAAQKAQEFLDQMAVYKLLTD
jgi:hypothetical protein